MVRKIAIVMAGLLAGGAAHAAGDPEAGKKVFARCGACHNITDVNKIGPGLHGLIGRTAGTHEGFNYSAANKASGVVWTAETLDPYLKDPKGYMPGNKMAFAGLKKDDERANVIAYLEQATK